MVICLSLLFNSVSKLCAMYKKYFKNLCFLFHFLALNPLDHYLALIHVSYCVLRKENANFVRLLEEQLKCVLDVKMISKTDDIESIAGLSSREVYS